MAQTFTVNLTITDSAGQSASATFAMTLQPATLVITTTSPLPDAKVGVAYSEQMAATGGTPPYTWTTTSGAFPPGLTMTQDGLITGTPT